LSWIIQTAIGFVKVIQKAPRNLANLFALRMSLKRFEKASNISMWNLE